jgi:hypothetical protein
MATSKKEKRYRIHLYNTISRVLGLDYAEGIHQANWIIGVDEHGLAYVADCDREFDKVQAFVKVLTLISTANECKELFKLFYMLKMLKSMKHTVRFNTETVNDLAGAVGSVNTRYVFYKVDFAMPFRQIKFYVHN